MNCPRCNSFLNEKEAVNYPFSLYVGECLGCGGWWLDNSKLLEEYRASILPTSHYTVLPKFEPITAQNPSQCSCCKQNTLLWNNVDSFVIQRCSKCSGVFLSKEQILQIVQKESNSTLEAGLEIGWWALILSYIFGC